MQKFVLKSDFNPSGDQPTAIAQLVEGVNKGEKQQTLLGATGTGKSVTAETNVIVFDSYEHTVLEVQIGNFIDELFDSGLYEREVSGDTEYINLPLKNGQQRYQTVSFDLNTHETVRKGITQVSRHRAENDLIRVRTDGGHVVDSTTDHGFFTLSEDSLVETRGDELSVGDYLPTPRQLVDQHQGKASISLKPYIDAQKAYVSIGDVSNENQDIVIERLPYQKKYRVERFDEKVPLHYIHDSCLSQQVPLYTARHAKPIPSVLTLTDDLLYAFGVYIAEGHVTRDARYSIVTNTDREVLGVVRRSYADIGLSFKERRSGIDYQTSSLLFSQFLGKNFGRVSRAKQLPDWWPELSNQQLTHMIRGIFDGDGFVDKNGIHLSVVSEKLIKQTALALKRYAIQSRVSQRFVSVPNSSKKSLVYQLSISNSTSIAHYNTAVGFSIDYKKRAAEVFVDRKSNTNVDVIPVEPSLYKKRRETLTKLQREVAKAAQCSRAMVGLIENGERRPSVSLYKRISEALSLDSSLSNFIWAKIVSIEKVQRKDYVYDFAVAGSENFLANGLFVHNTFTMANVIEQTQRPTLILCHNKTLAAQLYEEFKNFFPDNAVHYFVSYFDYYQPEAYVARSDTYIEKDSQLNEEIDRMRHAATDALLTRRDVIIIASVSCIYGIGSPTDYADLSVKVKVGERRVRDKFIRHLTDIQYERNDIDFHRGTFRVRGDVVDVFPAGEEIAYRIEFFGDEVDMITKIDALTGEVLGKPSEIAIFPSSHYATPQEKLKLALGKIEREMEARAAWFRDQGKYLEEQRISQRTRFDLEMLEETGFVKGIENYSRYLTEREEGEQPATLLDYYPDDFLLMIDESHMTVSQVRGIYAGDRARKEVLVEHGFRLPSALDNRPLNFTEFERHINQVIYVSATPGEYEFTRSPEPAQQVIRPTGLLDPQIEVRPIEHQVDDLIAEIREKVAQHQRVLVTTLTKRMSEDLTEYLQELQIKVAYIHSDVDTLERTDILRDLRMGVYDVLIGINLLREGLDLPEVSLVAILDADKEGFLRSETALVQTVGRAARHVEGRVIMYGDTITKSMKAAIDETNRRRAIQQAYNDKHGITPATIAKAMSKGIERSQPAEEKPKLNLKKIPKDEYKHLIKDLTSQMELVSANLEFEKAAELRDVIQEVKDKL